MMLALGCAGAAVILAASELMTTFVLVDPGGEEQLASDAIDRHSGAVLILALTALVALALAARTGSKPAAVAVAVCGGVALLIFLIGDLPDANRIGTLDDASESFTNAKAEPRQGFWFELIGSLLLATCGTALATLPEHRLRLLSGGGDGGGDEERRGEPEPPHEVVDYQKQL